MIQETENKKEKRSLNSRFNKFIDDLFSSAIETPFDILLQKYRLAILIINIIMVSVQIIISSVTMGFAYYSGNNVFANVIAVCLALYLSVIAFYVLFFFQDKRKEKEDRPVTAWSYYKKDFLLLLRLITTLLAITISITLFFSKTSNDIISIIVLVFSIINLVINSFVFIYQIVNLIYSLVHRNQYKYKVVNRDLKLKKRRLLYIYLQNQFRDYIEYSRKLDVEFKDLDDKMKRELALKEYQESMNEEEMPILAHLIDDQYENNGHDHIRKAVRGVVINKHGKIALTKIFRKVDHFGPRDYYELPGGGVDEGETLEEALIREMEEELGIIVRITHKIGRIDDYYNLIKQENHSYYFMCEIVAKTQMHREERESQLIQKVVWVSFDKAIKLYTNTSDVMLSRLVKNRELPILKIAKNEYETD